MIFSLDATIAFTIMLCALLVFLLTLNVYAQIGVSQARGFELEEKALLIADSMVKNYDANNTLLGACIVDYDKKRVRTNELTSTNIKQAKPTEFGKFFVRTISYETKTRKETTQLSAKKIVECLTAKRFVLIDGEKGVIQVQTCRSE
jgi:hypothetical protein